MPPRGLAGGQLHQPHRIALDALDPVVLRQPLVQERVIAVEQLQERSDPAGRRARRASRSRAAWPSAGRRSARTRGSGGTSRRTQCGPACSSFFSAALSCSGGLRFSSRNRARRFSASGSGTWSREITADALMMTDSMSRAWSHWPTKLRMNSAERGSASIRSTWARRFARSLCSAGQPDQLGVGHRRPEEVREPRRQGVFVDQGIPGRSSPARRPPRGRGTGARSGRPPSPARRRPRRSARSETRQPRPAPPADPSWRRPRGGGTPARRTGRGSREHRACVRRRSCGNLSREEAGVARRADPVSLVHRPADGHRLDADRQRPDLLLARA